MERDVEDRAAARRGEIGDFAVPRHVAIIMDGNGRWAAARGLPRGEGHRRGVEALRRTVRAAGDLGIGFLTIFSFSAENWSRPPAEIRELMALLRRFIRHDLADLHRNGVRVRVIGERESLDPDIRRLLDEAEELTKNNDKLVLVVAFNYGARQEIARAARRMAAAVAAGDLAVSAVTADKLASYLDAPDLPDPDLIIRTSGEQRLSNFLLWQAAYSELVFVPTYWPDFDRATLEGAITEYRPARTSLRRLDRAHRVVIRGGRGPSWRAFARSRQRACAARLLGAGAGAARDRDGLSRRLAVRRRSGGSRPWACCGNGPRWWREPIGDPC